MNAFDMARTAYASTAAPIRTMRGNEYEAFAKVTSELRNGIMRRTTDYNGFVASLHRNRQLWTILAGTVADSRNELSAELRGQLFYLSEFTQKHTRQVLSRKGDPAVLLEINAAVMRGLRGGEQRTPEPTA